AKPGKQAWETGSDLPDGMDRRALELRPVSCAREYGVADRIPGSLPLTDILLPRAICADASTDARN
ncbi:LOW QUALITY PROTEIN: predicted protein, partial [Brucella sp. 83/13]